MNDKGIIFKQNAKAIAFDNEHYELMMSNYQSFKCNDENNASLYSNLELEKERACFYRDKALKKLDKHLVDFDTNFTSNGGNILWANDAKDAKQMIINILNNKNIKKIIKTNSVTLEEIGLTSFLEMKKIKVIDTNIGDFVCHIINERPYHTNSSALHLKTSEIADLYSSEFGIKKNCNSKQLTNCTKILLKNEMSGAEAVITGANFLLSNSGSIVLTENEGNILKSCTYAPVHIIVAGIDKLLTSMDELNVLLPLSSLYKHSNISPYYHIINKPYNENGMTQELYLILLNNNRTKVLEKEKQRSILTCINCGACSDVCPIFNTIGGHVYYESNPGPVGAILSPIINGMDTSSHFCSLCTSCGRCSEVCPVKISIRDLFIENRKDLLQQDKSYVDERHLLTYLIKKMSSRKNLDKYASYIKDFELRQYIKKKWGYKREIPKFAKESFTEYWKNVVINK